MAPVSPVKRVTRARVAAKSAVSEPSSKKVSASKVSKTTASKAASTAARKTRATSDDNDETEPQMVTQEPEPPVQKKTARTTRTAILPAVPNRRIKVTPLDGPAAPKPATKEVEKPKKKASTRSKKTESDSAPSIETEAVSAKTRSRSTKTATTKTTTESQDNATTTASKARGRPKKSAAAEDKPPVEPVKTTRQTRARSASVASQQPSDIIEVATKSKTAGRKKVTFQDLPEDEKENVVMPAKKTATKKATPATGLRAKPVRKPATTTTTKTAPTTRSRVAKPAVRPLTPKKVTQVARASTPDASEDELAGAKSPVRDLTLSPKRNPNVAALLSPTKRLDFTQTLLAASPRKADDGVLMLSPARRPVTQAKNDATLEAVVPIEEAKASSLFQSPKRGVVDTSIFPPSAIKVMRSPFKESLLQSPARRLFSPAKSKAPLSIHRDTENVVEEISVSSHFRPSASPQRSARVYRLNDEELADELGLDMDFDQSVLKLTSPKKSPIKSMKSVMPAILDKEPEMQTIQNDAEETAKAVEELQSIDESLIDEASLVDEMEETIEPAQMSLTTTDDSAEEEEHATEQPEPLARGPRLSQVLFRTIRPRDEDESSEDELAADQTPDRAPRLFRSSLTGATYPRSRLSMTAAKLAGSQDDGFTPLATQMSGWLANSPQKTPARSSKNQTDTNVFSPLAGQHVPGEIQIRRDLTPQQHRASPSFRSSVTSRPTASELQEESPERSTFFAEQMSSMNDGFSAPARADDIEIFVDEDEDLTTASEIAAENDVLRSELQVQEAAPVDAEEEDETVIIHQAEELTTDLVNEVHATETAMLDFQELAKEAEELVEVEEASANPSSDSVYGDENAAPEDTLNFGIMHRDVTPEEQTLNLQVMEESLSPAATTAQQMIDHQEVDVPSSRAMTVFEDQTLNLHVLEQNMAGTPTYSDQLTAADEPTLHFDILEVGESTATTPAHSVYADEITLNLDVLEQNVADQTPTVTRQMRDPATPPEGSPAPMASPVKAVQSESNIATPRINFKGPRMVNTVVSKVPLKPAAGMSPIKMPKKRSRSMSMSRQQSTPKRPQLASTGKITARSTTDPMMSPGRSIQMSLPGTAQSTPGQVSFAIDDFGDSTLDGIELPEDEMDIDFTIQSSETPQTAKAMKTAKSVSRTPLKAVSEGMLNGAVIYVEVHTSEGADASGVYVDLLTQMGARCVREWRWNPRASVHGGDDLSHAGKPGITHVVYKDGGKRTLEKVRDARGEVWCVGVRWVLDCERNQEWVDEAPYVVDQNILPRGGSRRRKSMEPRALVNANGNLSTRSNTGRRSTSAEYMTSQMRDDLINTPVRTYQPAPSAAARESLGGDSFFGDSDISSTYNSPTTTMNIHHVATPTALVGWDPATSKTPAKADGADVGMDTPYLMKQGGMVMEPMLGRDGGVMSAPPKQIGRGLFDDGDDIGDIGVGKENTVADKGQQKMKLKLQEARRRTLGFKPVVGSPLGKF